MIFDSGVGGLSVLKAVRNRLPSAPIIYVADNAGYPYGTKSAATIEARVPAMLGRLAERYDPGLIVIACNTASTIALDSVRSALDLPVVGTVPAIKPAAALSRSRVIGVLGTPATVVQPYVDRLAAEFAGDCTVLRHGSSELVDLAEAKLKGEFASTPDFASIMAGLLEQKDGDLMDVVVLACTHFPLVQDELESASPRPLTFVDGNAGIARRTAWLARDMHWPSQDPQHLAVFTSRSADVEAYRPGMKAFGLNRIETL
ncbi:MAG: glutamate racemase [Allosphingosinicella sp.]